MSTLRGLYDNKFVGYVLRELCILWVRLKGVIVLGRITATRDGRIILLGYKYLENGVEMAYTVWCTDELLKELKQAGLFKPGDE